MPKRSLFATLATVAACAASPASVSAQTYQFGSSMFLSTKLRMASFGPMRSAAVDCSDAKYFCLKADYLAIAVPRHCDKMHDRPGTYSVDRIDFHVLGTVRYEKERVVLVNVPSRQGFAFGYTPAGVSFVMIAPLVRGQMLDLGHTGPGKPLQAAFEKAKPYLIARTGDEAMFNCVASGTPNGK